MKLLPFHLSSFIWILILAILYPNCLPILKRIDDHKHIEKSAKLVILTPPYLPSKEDPHISPSPRVVISLNS